MRKLIRNPWVLAVGAILCLALFVFSLSTLRRVYPFGIINLEQLPFEGRQRLLILAPHDDDETLSSAGLILAAQRAGMQVRVVMETNGDGFLFAVMEESHRVNLHHTDYIRMGNLRQQETLNALQMLGVTPGQVTFLGYPDRGTPALWNDHWSRGNPYLSPYNGSSRSPYNLTYDPQANYSGESLLGDLRSILEDYRPDLIIYPHPDDIHPDHWGLSAFTRAALALEEQADPSYQPEAFAYLVHRPGYPWPRGLHEQLNLLPPLALYAISPGWLTLDLSPEDTSLKTQAVLQYRSQLAFLRGMLESFVRSNELFAQVSAVDLPLLVQGDWHDPATWLDEDGQPIEPIEKDPLRDSPTRKVLPGADLVGTYAARTPEGSLVVCSQARGRLEPTLQTDLRVIAMGPQGVIHSAARSGSHPHAGDLRLVRTSRNACYQVGLAVLGDPWWVFIGVDVREMGLSILDQVAWQMVRVSQPVGGG